MNKDLTKISSRFTNFGNTMKVYGSGTSKFLFTGEIAESDNLCTMDAAKDLHFDNVEFVKNGELIAEHDTFNDVLFGQNGTLHVDTCIFDTVEIHQLGLAYSNNCKYTRFLFSTYPTWWCDCCDNRNHDYGLLQGDNNQIFEMINFNRNGTIKGNNNNADSCRFNANGNLLAGSNEFNIVMMQRIWVYGCSCGIYSKDTLTVEKNKIQTIHDSIILFGGYNCEHTRITSTDNTVQATIATDHPQFLDYIELKGINGNIIIPPSNPDTAKRSVDLGNNSNWYFKNNYIPLEDSAKTVTDVFPCSDNHNGTVTIWAKGGEKPYTYYRYTGSGCWCGTCWSPNTPSTSNVFTGLAKGNYQFKIVDAYGCESVIVNATVGGPEPVIISSVDITPIPCYHVPPFTDGQVVVHASGGTGALQYYMDGKGWQASNTFINVSLGIHTIQVKDVSNCLSVVDTITMTQRPEMFMIIQTPETVTCWGDSSGIIKIQVWGGTFPDSVFIIPVAPVVHAQNTVKDKIISSNLGSPRIYKVFAGSYHIVIKDTNGCIIEDYRQVFENPKMNYTYSKETVTVGSSTTYCLEVTPTGGVPGYTHLWNNGATTKKICGLVPGWWCDTITDSQGCRDTACILIEPLSIQPIVPDTVCYGKCNGSACVLASGGSTPYGYLWSNNTTQPCLINVCHGTYTVTVTDASGGIVIDSVLIYENPQITGTFTIDTVSCGGGQDGSLTINAAGGTPYLPPPGYHYLWSTGKPYNVANVATGLSAGAYTVTVSDAKSCTNSFSVVMPQPPPISISFKTSSNCTTYSAEAIVSGGNPPYSYVWSPGGQITNPAAGLLPGTYTVTVTDAKSCTKIGSVAITALAVATTITNVTCYGACNGTATASASGGNKPYSITWTKFPSGDIVPGNPIINLCPGDYMVTVLDSNNCPVSKTVTISQPANPLEIATLTYTAMLDCYGDCDGQAAVFASGGTGSYTYKWEKSTTPGFILGTGQIINGLCAGTYCVTVTDVRGCFVDTCFTILQPAQILFTYSKADINCFSDGDAGQITIGNVTGGTSPYVYTINCPLSGYGSSP
ncbi:MAG: SprB repeat-containing protein, partial [Bacteroidota bacterium]